MSDNNEPIPNNEPTSEPTNEPTMETPKPLSKRFIIIAVVSVLVVSLVFFFGWRSLGAKKRAGRALGAENANKVVAQKPTGTGSAEDAKNGLQGAKLPIGSKAFKVSGATLPKGVTAESKRRARTTTEDGADSYESRTQTILTRIDESDETSESDSERRGEKIGTKALANHDEESHQIIHKEAGETISEFDEEDSDAPPIDAETLANEITAKTLDETIESAVDDINEPDLESLMRYVSSDEEKDEEESAEVESELEEKAIEPLDHLTIYKILTEPIQKMAPISTPIARETWKAVRQHFLEQHPTLDEERLEYANYVAEKVLGPESETVYLEILCRMGRTEFVKKVIELIPGRKRLLKMAKFKRHILTYTLAYDPALIVPEKPPLKRTVVAENSISYNFMFSPLVTLVDIEALRQISGDPMEKLVFDAVKANRKDLFSHYLKAINEIENLKSLEEKIALLGSKKRSICCALALQSIKDAKATILAEAESKSDLSEGVEKITEAKTVLGDLNTERPGTKQLRETAIPSSFNESDTDDEVEQVTTISQDAVLHNSKLSGKKPVEATSSDVADKDFMDWSNFEANVPESIEEVTDSSYWKDFNSDGEQIEARDEVVTKDAVPIYNLLLDPKVGNEAIDFSIKKETWDAVWLHFLEQHPTLDVNQLRDADYVARTIAGTEPDTVYLEILCRMGSTEFVKQVIELIPDRKRLLNAAKDKKHILTFAAGYNSSIFAKPPAKTRGRRTTVPENSIAYSFMLSPLVTVDDIETLKLVSGDNILRLAFDAARANRKDIFDYYVSEDIDSQSLKSLEELIARLGRHDFASALQEIIDAKAKKVAPAKKAKK